MYLSHYNLELKPFQISTDPKFLWFGENHKEAFAILKYGILDNKGFLLLTGDVGTGKTTLINALVNSLGKNVIAATVPDPNLEALDFFNYIASAFGIDKRFGSKGDFLFYFNRFLNGAYRKSKRVLLIIDESQRLNHDLLEEIRLLSNIEKQNTKLLNIFFVGQNEFNDLLWETRNRALRQRITVNYNVYALNEKEVGAYVRHRLKVAGTEAKIFSFDAVRAVMNYSGGFPRTINIICDHALLTGFVKGIKTIDAEVIRECVEDLRIPKHFTKPESEHGPQNIFDAELKFSSESLDKAEPAPENFEEKNKKHPFFNIAIVLLILIFVGYALYYYKSSMLHDQIVKKWEELTSHPDTAEIKKIRPQLAISDPLNADETEMPGEKDIPLENDEVFAEKITSAREGVDQIIASKKRKEGNYITSTSEKNELSISKKTNSEKLAGFIKIATRSIENDNSDIDKKNLSLQESLKQKQKKVSELISILENKHVITFPYNSNSLSKNDVKNLDRIVEVLTNYPDLSVNIVGYTDSSGVYSYNKSLSRFRANIVKSFLVGRGVDDKQIATIGMGSINPVDTNETSEGRSSNRRVELEFNYEKLR